MSDARDSSGLTRRRLLGATLTTGVAAAGAGAGTSALFSDTEASTGNTIQAGTLDLSVGSDVSLSASVTNARPGQTGTLVADVRNDGSVEGGLSVGVNVTGHAEGDTPESEPTYPRSGELRDELEVEVGFDDDTSDSARHPVLTAASIGTVDLEGRRDALKRLAAGDTTNLYVDWAVDANATNDIQGDSLEFEVVVGFHQPEPITVDDSGGADHTSIQAAVDAAGAGETIQVAGGSYAEAVLVGTDDVQVLGDGSGSVTVDAGGAKNGIEIEASGVTLSGFTVEHAGQAIDVNGQDTSAGRASDVALTDVVVGSNVTDRGFVVDHTDRAAVKNVTSNNNGNDGITLWYTNDSRVEHVTANDNGDNGVYFNGDNNTLIDATANRNIDEGVDVNWYDDLASSQQRVVVDTVTAMDNGEDDVELHDNGTDDSGATNSKLLKQVETGGAPVGLRLVQVAASEVQTVRSTFPNGQLDGNDNDVDP